MDGFLLILLGIFLAFLLTIILLIWGVRTLYKKGFKKLGTAAVLILSCLALFIFYLVYTAIFPDDRFYKDEFEADLKTPFPTNAHIVAKDSDFPDTHGDYLACCAIKMDAKSYRELAVKFPNNIVYDSIGFSNPYDKVAKAYGRKDISAIHEKIESDDKRYYLIFLNDNKTVIFYRASW